MTRDDDNKLVILTNVPSLPDAEIIRGMLADNDIPSALQTNDNLYVPIFGGTDILVRASDYDRALQLLERSDD